MKNILYLHGFASSIHSAKLTELRRIFPQNQIHAFEFQHSPKKDYQNLRTYYLNRKDGFNLVVGSSLGGFYALRLARDIHIKALLVNPALEPHKTLSACLGKNRIYGDEPRYFDWSEKEVSELEALSHDMTRDNYSNIEWASIMLMLSIKDELLDSMRTREQLPHARVILDPEQTHRFENLWKYRAQITEYLHEYQCFDPCPPGLFSADDLLQ